jgi:hypothetical protein
MKSLTVRGKVQTVGGKVRLLWEEIVYFPISYRGAFFRPRACPEGGNYRHSRLEIFEPSGEMDFFRPGVRNPSLSQEIFKICIISVWDSNIFVLGRKSVS